MSIALGCCILRLLDDEAALCWYVLAVATERNAHRRGIALQFTARDARMKLEKLYPIKSPSPN